MSPHVLMLSLLAAVVVNKMSQHMQHSKKLYFSRIGSEYHLIRSSKQLASTNTNSVDDPEVIFRHMIN